MQERIEEKSFPNNLEDRLAIIANALNTEFKSAILLHLDDTPREAPEIRVKVRETIGRGYLPSKSTFGTYGDTLHEIALVAKKTITRDTGEVEYIGYSLTEAGKTYGLPCAVLSLRYAVDNNISMFQILGSTASPGESRAPYNRIRILRELRNSEELREIDLKEALDLYGYTVRNHLDGLVKIGFVEFDSVGAKTKGKYKFQWIKSKPLDKVEAVRHHTTLTRRVAECLANNDKAFDYNELSKVLRCGNVQNISTVLCGLERQGRVIRIFPWKAGELMSKVRILDNGRKFHDELYLPLTGLLSDSSLEVSRQEQETFRESQEYANYIRRGIELYRRVSPNINKKSPEERIEEIKALLRNKPGMTSRKIADILGISWMRITKYLSQLSKEIRIEEEGNEVRYFSG
ncbi:helix-turn-helix transcriptional regulator [Candidatus Pacearchaeota archaeon]|nr:helix-turn-helix transcriptional regulator [Candidatus Pacearchaeota archaeon]